jgi:hypothetical protein
MRWALDPPACGSPAACRLARDLAISRARAGDLPTTGVIG